MKTKSVGMKKDYIVFIISLLCICCLANTAQAQIVLSGHVREVKGGTGVSDINVILQNRSGKGMIDYTLTDENGRFTLHYSGNADTLRLLATGMNIKAVHIMVPAKSDNNLIIRVESGALKLKEVVVKAPPLRRRGDTISYYVNSYIDTLRDRSIGDVLKKMPGVRVDENGRIAYNGKDVSILYIEGLNMLDAGYGVATNHVRAKDIAKVDVMEFHQPVKALKNKVASDMVAMNLHLKEKVKGTFNETFTIGGGFKPLMWTGETTAMYFARTFQTFDNYQTNNTGIDVSAEIESMGSTGGLSAMSGITTPPSPPIARSRYLKNNIHAFSANMLVKKKNLEYVSNIKYCHDIRNSAGSSVSTYYFQNQDPLVVTENTAAHTVKNNVVGSFWLTANTDSLYLKDKLNISGTWNKSRSTVNTLQQEFTSPTFYIGNDFSYVKPMKKTSLNFDLNASYARLPSTLRVNPYPYLSVFGLPDTLSIMSRQKVTTDRLSGYLSTGFGRDFNNWHFGIFGSASAWADRMTSGMSYLKNAGGVGGWIEGGSVADSLRNDINLQSVTVDMGPYVSINYDNFILSINPYVRYKYLGYNDKVADSKFHMNKLDACPTMSLRFGITEDLKFSASGQYRVVYGGLTDVYSGYIIEDYRSVSGTGRILPKDENQNYSASFNYGNALISVFGALSGSYWHNKSNLMYGNVFYGDLSRIKSYEISNSSSGYGLNGNISKRFNDIATTFTLSAGMSKSNGKVYRNGDILKTSYTSKNCSFEITGRIGYNFDYDYNITYSTYKTSIENSSLKLKSIDAVKEKLTLDASIAKSVVIKVSGEHYYNNSITSGDKNMFFADASVSYKRKRVEYIISARNLFYTKSYNTSYYNSINSYSYSCDLRPLSVLFTVSFSLR
jgi:hypothetical protein